MSILGNNTVLYIFNKHINQFKLMRPSKPNKLKPLIYKLDQYFKYTYII